MNTNSERNCRQIMRTNYSKKICMTNKITNQETRQAINLSFSF